MKNMQRPKLDNIEIIEGELRALCLIAEEADLACARYDLPELREAVLAYERGEVPPLATREHRKRFRERMAKAVSARIDEAIQQGKKRR
jgi:hypothetical protein